MTQYKDIPQPTDNRNVSQGDILHNFEYLLNVSNPAAIVGILPVDHYASSDNTANPTDGFHKQISFLNQTSPTTLTNAINAQNSNAITYTKNDSANNAQLHFYNGPTGGVGGQMDYPISIIKAYVTFNGSTLVPVIRGTAFNVTSVTRTGALGSGTYNINFTQTLPNNTYIVLATAGRGDNVTAIPAIISEYPYNGAFGTFRTTTSVRIQSSNGSSAVDSGSVNVVIIGL